MGGVFCCRGGKKKEKASNENFLSCIRGTPKRRGGKTNVFIPMTWPAGEGNKPHSKNCKLESAHKRDECWLSGGSRSQLDAKERGAERGNLNEKPDNGARYGENRQTVTNQRNPDLDGEACERVEKRVEKKRGEEKDMKNFSSSREFVDSPNG